MINIQSASYFLNSQIVGFWNEYQVSKLWQKRVEAKMYARKKSGCMCNSCCTIFFFVFYFCYIAITKVWKIGYSWMQKHSTCTVILLQDIFCNSSMLFLWWYYCQSHHFFYGENTNALCKANLNIMCMMWCEMRAPLHDGDTQYLAL